ncbi:hypothetical protein J2T16_000554 [Paenibacillus intestini]|nr:hypothetical protein [Paenibacillus intestini]
MNIGDTDTGKKYQLKKELLIRLINEIDREREQWTHL